MILWSRTRKILPASSRPRVYNAHFVFFFFFSSLRGLWFNRETIKQERNYSNQIRIWFVFIFMYCLLFLCFPSTCIQLTSSVEYGRCFFYQKIKFKNLVVSNYCGSLAWYRTHDHITQSQRSSHTHTHTVHSAQWACSFLYSIFALHQECRWDKKKTPYRTELNGYCNGKNENNTKHGRKTEKKLNYDS